MRRVERRVVRQVGELAGRVVLRMGQVDGPVGGDEVGTTGDETWGGDDPSRWTLVSGVPADPATLDKVKLFKGTPDTSDGISVRRSLSQDARTLLVTPNKPLDTGATYVSMGAAEAANSEVLGRILGV